MPRIKYLEGVVPAGTKAHCGDGKSCGYYVGIRKNHPEVTRLTVGWKTIRFHLDGRVWTIPTPTDMLANIREFDRRGEDGTCLILDKDWAYRIPLNPKNSKPVKTMTSADKERLTKRAAAGLTREQLDRQNELARASNARIKQRLS